MRTGGQTERKTVKNRNSIHYVRKTSISISNFYNNNGENDSRRCNNSKHIKSDNNGYYSNMRAGENDNCHYHWCNNIHNEHHYHSRYDDSYDEKL